MQCNQGEEGDSPLIEEMEEIRMGRGKEDVLRFLCLAGASHQKTQNDVSGNQG